MPSTSETTGAPHRQEGPTCPFCGSTDSEMVALFGSQLLTSQFYCRGCHTVFEAVRHGADVSADEEGTTANGE